MNKNGFCTKIKHNFLEHKILFLLFFTILSCVTVVHVVLALEWNDYYDSDSGDTIPCNDNSTFCTGFYTTAIYVSEAAFNELSGLINFDKNKPIGYLATQDFDKLQAYCKAWYETEFGGQVTNNTCTFETLSIVKYRSSLKDSWMPPEIGVTAQRVGELASKYNQNHSARNTLCNVYCETNTGVNLPECDVCVSECTKYNESNKKDTAAKKACYNALDALTKKCASGDLNCGHAHAEPWDTPTEPEPEEPKPEEPKPEEPPGGGGPEPEEPEPEPVPGYLDVTITDMKGNRIEMKPAGITVYKGSGCTGSIELITNITANGIIPLDGGSYSVDETSAPSGYAKNPKNQCTDVTITSGSTVSVAFTNEQACEAEFNELPNKTDPIARVELYQHWLGKGKNYTNLLNFSITDASEACSRNTSCGLTRPVEIGCLSASGSGSFSSTDMSCYTSTITVGSSTGSSVGYCYTSFDMLNNLNGTMQYTKTYNFGSNFRSGMMILNRTAGNKVIARASLGKTCYVYGIGVGNTVSVDNDPISNYSAYVSDVRLDNKSLPHTDTKTGWTKTANSSILSTFKTSVDAEYSLNPVYAANGSGKIVDGPCYDNTCKLIGYGFSTPFTLETGQNYVDFSMNFSPSFSSDLSVSTTSKACTYSNIKELLDIDPGHLRLKYRIIDSNVPFPGKSGLGRITGGNWCSNGDCSNTNLLVSDEILNSNDSYNKTSGGPIYTIRLTSDIIKKIRDYNKTNPYDDYKLTCDADGYNCKSNFLSQFNINRA